MRKWKILWMTFIGSMSSIVTFIVSVVGIGCAGTCGAACIAPIASLLGVSSLGFFASSIWKDLQPVLIAVTAVAFTINYFIIFKKPTAEQECAGCFCSEKEISGKRKKLKFIKVFYWVSVIISSLLIFYPIYSKLHEDINSANTRVINNPAKDSSSNTGTLILEKQNSIPADSVKTNNSCSSGTNNCSSTACSSNR